jgi:hypothetical protein
MYVCVCVNDFFITMIITMMFIPFTISPSGGDWIFPEKGEFLRLFFQTLLSLRLLHIFFTPSPLPSFPHFLTSLHFLPSFLSLSGRDGSSCEAGRSNGSLCLHGASLTSILPSFLPYFIDTHPPIHPSPPPSFLESTLPLLPSNLPSHFPSILPFFLSSHFLPSSLPSFLPSFKVRQTQRIHEENAARAVLAETQEVSLRQTMEQWKQRCAQADKHDARLKKTIQEQSAVIEDLKAAARHQVKGVPPPPPTTIATATTAKQN